MKAGVRSGRSHVGRSAVAGLPLVALGVVPELALEARPVQPRHAVGLGRRLLVDGLVTVGRLRLVRPRDSQAASAETMMPAP